MSFRQRALKIFERVVQIDRIVLHAVAVLPVRMLFGFSARGKRRGVRADRK